MPCTLLLLLLLSSWLLLLLLLVPWPLNVTLCAVRDAPGPISTTAWCVQPCRITFCRVKSPCLQEGGSNAAQHGAQHCSDVGALYMTGVVPARLQVCVHGVSKSLSQMFHMLCLVAYGSCQEPSTACNQRKISQRSHSLT